MINSLSVAVTNFQPLNDGKKWLAKVQAGDYPEGEMSAKLDQYIQNNPVGKSRLYNLKLFCTSPYKLKQIPASWSVCILGG